MNRRRPARRTWWLAGGSAALVLVLILIAALLPRTGEDDRAASSPHPTPSLSKPEPEPWTSIYVPGFNPTPNEFDLGSVPDGKPITASLSADDQAVANAGAVGLSFDATDLASEAWDSPESNLALTLAEMDSPSLRFGGNGVDRRMWWTSSGEHEPEWAEATVTPADLERVAAVAEEVDAEITLVLDLGHDDPARAADMAAHAKEAFGDRLIAITVGNEPNGFFHPNQPNLAMRDDDWDTDEYQDQLAEYAQAIEDAAPGIDIAGPGAYDAPWWRAFAETDLPQDKAALSMHWYPLWDCDGPAKSIANPTVEDLTSPEIRDRAYKMFDMATDVADKHSLPLWLEETGPTSCPGTNETSRTHAQALWTVDFALTAMESGVERMAFHSTLHACQGGAPMSPICALGDVEDPGLILGGRSSYLSLMMLGWLPDGRVLQPDVSGKGEVMVHGVHGDDGELGVVIVDMREPGAADAVPVEIQAPSSEESWELAEGSMLTGESLSGEASELGAPAAVSGEYENASLSSTEPLTVPSEPGSVTMLLFDSASSD